MSENTHYRVTELHNLASHAHEAAAAAHAKRDHLTAQAYTGISFFSSESLTCPPRYALVITRMDVRDHTRRAELAHPNR